VSRSGFHPRNERTRPISTRFIAFVNGKYGLKVGSYSELYRWSIEKVSDFWSGVWDYVGIISSRRFEKVVDDLNEFREPTGFQGLD